MRLKAPEPHERDVQRTIVEGLRWKGFQVQEIAKTRARVRCYDCGAQFYPKGWQGTTPGTPDLFITRPEWRGAWIAIEVKTFARRSKPEPEQQALLDAGFASVARSWEEAEAIIQQFEETLTWLSRKRSANAPTSKSP